MHSGGSELVSSMEPFTSAITRKVQFNSLLKSLVIGPCLSCMCFWLADKTIENQNWCGRFYGRSIWYAKLHFSRSEVKVTRCQKAYLKVTRIASHERRFTYSTGTYLPYLTLPPGWAGSYTCPALRPYQFGPMHIPECNHKVTGSGYKAVVGYEAKTSTKALVTCSKSALTGLVSS